jgi:hypothetical protein
VWRSPSSQFLDAWHSQVDSTVHAFAGGALLTDYWRAIRDHAKSDGVRMNARAEINKLSEEGFWLDVASLDHIFVSGIC